MMLIAVMTAHMIINMVDAIPTAKCGKLCPARLSYDLVTRSQWNARRPVETTPLKVPVPYVIIHHTFIPPTCYSKEECAYAMRTMQSMHVDQNKWWDIGYNFCVGDDGVVYEGRGWHVKGAHAGSANSHSIGICLIGDFREVLPPTKSLEATQALIAEGVEKGFISTSYKLIGHKQAMVTECPGTALLDQVSYWSHYVSGHINFNKTTN